MRLRFSLVLMLMVVLLASIATPNARATNAHGVGSSNMGVTNYLEMTNKTAHAWVWVTAYNAKLSGIVAAFCVGPDSKARREIFSQIYEVRAEVTDARNCTGRRLLDGLRGYPWGSGHDFGFYIHAVGHGYVYNNTP